MTITVGSAHLSLDAREILTVRDGRGARVVCLSGVVWITQEGDLRDVVLRGGASFVLDRPGTALVTAVEVSRVRVEQPALAAA
jgi:hypothetical protein